MFLKVINEIDVTSLVPNYFGTHIGLLNFLECPCEKILILKPAQPHFFG